MWTAEIFARQDFLAQLTGVSKVNLQPKVVFFIKLILSEGKGLYMMLMITYINVSTPGWNGSRDCARSRGITRELRPVFTRDIAFQRQNSLKFTRRLARNSFSRFESVNHGHTPDLA